MKKLTLIALFTAVVSYAYAQKPALIMPQPNVLDKLTKSYIFPTDSSKAKPKPNEIVATRFTPTNNDIIMYSRMPVSKVQGFNSKMPVAGKGSSITGYNMPVKRVQIINPDSVGKVRINP